MNGGFPARILGVGLCGTVLILSGCGSGGSSTGGSSDPAESGAPARTYGQALYTVKIPASWVLRTGDEPTDGHLESIWRDRADPRVSILIEAAVPALGSPVSRAGSARARTGRAAGYRELDFKPTSLAGRRAVRWVFELSGRRRVEYFFNQCEVAVTVLGSSPPAKFGSPAAAARQAASSLAVRCP